MPKARTRKARASQNKSVRRCTQCPNLPLRSECVHSKAGIASADASPSRVLPITNVSPTDPTQSPRNLDRLIPEPTHYFDPNIDPACLSQSHHGSTMTPIVSPQTPEALTPTPATANPEATVDAGGRARITASNAEYGHVEGAKRGNLIYDVIRTKPLRPTITESQAAAKRFHRIMADLLVRCENLSHETGCWLYIGAQHPTASTGFTHYISPRLRREAKTQLPEIQQQLSNMFTALVASRRREAMDLSMQLMQAQEQQRDALTEADKARHALEQEQLQGATKDHLIAKLQAIINSFTSDS